MKKSNTNKQQEEKLKELTYQHAKEIGTKFQELASSEISTNEVDNMNKAMEKAILMNLEIDKLRQLINKINTDRLDDIPVPENSEYKYAYYLYLLACATKNIRLINYAKQLKERVLKDETK